MKSKSFVRFRPVVWVKVRSFKTPPRPKWTIEELRFLSINADTRLVDTCLARSGVVGRSRWACGRSARGGDASEGAGWARLEPRAEWSAGGRVSQAEWSCVPVAAQGCLFRAGYIITAGPGSVPSAVHFRASFQEYVSVFSTVFFVLTTGVVTFHRGLWNRNLILCGRVFLMTVAVHRPRVGCKVFSWGLSQSFDQVNCDNSLCFIFSLTHSYSGIYQCFVDLLIFLFIKIDDLCWIAMI